MRNTFLIILIIAVMAAGGFLFWRGFAGAPAQKNELHPTSTPLAPVIKENQSSASTAAVEKIYRQSVDISSRAFFFGPDMFRVRRGEKVTVNVKAEGNHTFTIDELKVDAKTPGGKTTKVEFTPQKTGVFKYYCAIPGHREGGQEGILIVE